MNSEEVRCAFGTDIKTGDHCGTLRKEGVSIFYKINLRHKHKIKFFKDVGECRKLFMYNILAKLKRKEYYTNGIFR